jgi:hypothetical protein
LAKENIKAKIKLTLLLMPDDIRQKFYQAIKKMMEERIKDPKTGFLETIGLQVGLKALNDELIAEFLYEEIVKDTARLREFLKLLNELLKVTQPPEKPTLPPATPSSAEEVNWADWLEDFGNKLLIKAIGNCQPKKTPCMNKCKCERPYYVCGMKNIIECNTDCSVEIGCDACRKDEDCQRLSQEVGYKLKCTPLNNPDAPEVGVCGFVIPAVKL